MNRPTRLLTAALAVAAVTLPAATAQAAATPRAASVGAHVKKAQGAQSRVATLVKRNDVRNAKRVLRTARHEAVVAARQAQSLAANAGSSDKAAQDAVWSLTTSAGNLSTAIEQYSALLPQATGAFQQLLANAIPGSIAGREQLVQSLTELVSQLSGTAQSLAAQALAALQASSPEQVQALAETASTELPAKIEGIINAALSAATEAMKTGLQTLTAIVPSLPSAAQEPIAGALSSLSSLVEGLLPQVQNLTTSISGMVQQVLSFVRGLMPDVSGFLGGSTSGGTAPATGDNPVSGISGLLGGLTGLVPDFGGLIGRLFA